MTFMPQCGNFLEVMVTIKDNPTVYRQKLIKNELLHFKIESSESTTIKTKFTKYLIQEKPCHLGIISGMELFDCVRVK